MYDSFSDGSVYFGRAIAAAIVVAALAILIHLI